MIKKKPKTLGSTLFASPKNAFGRMPLMTTGRGGKGQAPKYGKKKK